MPTEVIAKAGQYYIQERVWFDLKQTDAGTVICVSDGRVNRRYSICLDEYGCIVHGEVQCLSKKVQEASAQPLAVPPVITHHTEAYDINLLDRAIEKAKQDPMRRFKALAKHRFTLRWGKHARPRNMCFPMAGYANENATYIFFRVPSSLKREDLMRLLPSDLALIDKDDPDRLSRDEWERFLDMKEGEVFRRDNHSWKKLSAEEIGILVAGKVFKRAASDRD